MAEMEELQPLREDIDEVDQALLDLLARRKQLVAEVGEVKKRHGLPVYVPSREKAMLAARRLEAEAKGLSPDLVEDILRRVMRESYASESNGFKTTAPEMGPVVVIGGGSGMGGLMVSMLQRSGYGVRVLEKDDWSRAKVLLADAALVVVSVPIHVTSAVIDQVAPFLSKDCILADVTSIKAEPVRRMLAAHQGPVVGLHPMFGPKTGSWAKQLVVCCHGRRPEAYAWLLEQIKIWGAGVLESQPEKHDHMMGTIQAMRHFATYVYGTHLYLESADLDETLAYSSPIYRLELGMVGRLFAQDPNLYADIIFSSMEGRAIAERYHRRFERELEILRSGDRDTFVARFREISTWFGEHAQRFLEESSFMLGKVYERYGDRQGEDGP